MANYFTSDQDLTYLDATTRARSDIELLRREAEDIVIANYRRQVPDRRFTSASVLGEDTLTTGLENLSDNAGESKVYLQWYHEDADDVGATAQELLFLKAIRREIAAVVVHLASQRPDGGSSERAIKSESRGRRSVTYADNGATGEVPSNFGRYLKPFDLREELYSL